MRCHESVILAPGRMRQEDSQFEASLDYIGKHCQRKRRKENRKEERREGRKKERKKG